MPDVATDDAYLAELERATERIWEIARGMGLDPFPVNFELVPASIMYEFGSYGLPGRFSHWTRGKSYYRMKTEYDYGLSKIYELVVNTNPSYAFLMEQNSLLQNKLVVAHVLGHSDFFKNNIYFRHTPPNMIDKVSVNADRIRKYEYEHGRLEVERFLDAVLAIEEHIDPNVHIKRRQPEDRHSKKDGPRESPYDDLLKLDARPAAGEAEEEPPPAPPRRVPQEPEKDLLLFLAEHAPALQDWQRDILLIVREEMLYFVPQMQTKIMNEGWASLAHARILRELDLTDAEYTEFAQLHSSVLSPNRMRVNPYHLGYKIFEDIERRWDHPTEEQQAQGMQPGQGKAKIFQVREDDNDVSFLRNYLTKELVEDLDLYLYKKIGDEWVIVDKDWEHVRDAMVANMTNFGYPYLTANDADFNQNSELLLHHAYEGLEMDLPYAEKTLEYVQLIWGRPVHLDTQFEGRRVRLSYTGEKHVRQLLDRPARGERARQG
ncbi:MAG TPA: SpoVR family protein [Ktedonobacterales bacterium]|nr:SpoVR family protein [Ktedonobacterales bacterium]